jgi:phosphatidylserine/phosphatidylglycerophosphate/cardiolipin synthase-like enzyme
VLPMLKGAKKYIYFINQSFGASNLPDGSAFKKLVEALRDQAKAKLDVRLIIRDLSGVAANLVAMQDMGFKMANVKVQSALHTKGIIVDDKEVLIGSHNWTSQGVESNRDASLLFRDSEIAKYFKASFLQDWDQLARQKISSLENPPRLVLEPSRTTGGVSGGVVSWWDYFGG